MRKNAFFHIVTISDTIHIKKEVKNVQSSVSEEVKQLKIMVTELKGKVEDGERKERERNKRKRWWRIWGQ